MINATFDTREIPLAQAGEAIFAGVGAGAQSVLEVGSSQMFRRINEVQGSSLVHSWKL